MVAMKIQGSMAKFRKQYGANVAERKMTAGTTEQQRVRLLHQDQAVQKSMASAFAGVLFEVT